MGCSASKLENEDTVRRCKERRRLMKEAVYARHHLAAAHFDYCRSLRVTGSALSTFSAGEPLAVSDQTPAVFLRTPSTTTTTTKTTTKHYEHPPPPPIYVPSPSPSLHKPSPSPPPPPISPSVKSTHLRRKKPPQQPIKLPHILSDSSSFSSSPRKPEKNFTYHARANSTFSNTPSQDGSSVWNWEHFYPPSPPHSDYFDQLQTKKGNNTSNSYHYLDEDEADDDDKSSNYTSYSRYSHKASSHVGDQKGRVEIHQPQPQPQPRPNHWESEEGEREEVQCGEWGDHDHYSTTSSSDVDGDDDEDDLMSRSDIGTRSNFSEAIGGGKGNSRAPSMSNVNLGGVKYSTNGKLDKLSDDGESSSMSWGYGKGKDNEMVSDRTMVVRHKDLAEIVAAIKDYFDKAAAAGDQVSEMLETGRAQLDRSFTQLKKTVYHSSGLLSTLSSSWSSKPPLAVKYRFEPMSIEQSGGTKSLCSTLERLFAWEKKLYEEVKARERVKIEHEKKLSTLQSQEGKGDDDIKLDKTKASINRLHSLMVVTSQAVSSTSSAIISQRDSELVPQLVELCHGFMYMWRSMNQFHEVQNDIVQQVRGLINRSIKGELTSDLHRQATRDLESAVSAWHSSFCRLIKFQRDFTRSLHGWFKLTLTPVNSEPNHGNRDPSDAFAFCDEWKLALDRIPDTVASEAIKSFINVVHSISSTQTEEMKIKKRTESAAKELEKRASSLRTIEKKYYNSYSMVGLGLPDTGADNGHALDARDPLAEKKAELATCQRRVEDEMVKHSKAVEVTRAMTLNNLQTGLPGVFQALTSFSALITEALEAACTRSYAIK